MIILLTKSRYTALCQFCRKKEFHIIRTVLIFTDSCVKIEKRIKGEEMFFVGIIANQMLFDAIMKFAAKIKNKTNGGDVSAGTVQKEECRKKQKRK